MAAVLYYQNTNDDAACPTRLLLMLLQPVDDVPAWCGVAPECSAVALYCIIDRECTWLC